MIYVVDFVIGVLLFAALLYAAVVSLLDGERRAAFVSLLLSFLVPLPFIAAGTLEFPNRHLVAVALLVIAAAAVLVMLVPVPGRHERMEDTPQTRIDERDIMFSRRLLEPGTKLFEEYYERNPEKKSWDDKFRSRPGLLASGAAYYDPFAFKAATASFDTIERLRPHVDGLVAENEIDTDPGEVTQFLRGWALKLGAHSVGITELRDYHMYSVVGRGPDYGRPVEHEHDYAIALTVEMDSAMLKAGPRGSTVMESAQAYVDSGTIAVQMAMFIRSLGYDARAHIDGNYRVVCPLVARDAGLGEIGRMGLLMTPDLGPRVRIAVVTTDLRVIPDEREPDSTVLDYCVHCKKCATCCPPWAIPFEDRKVIDGVARWQINQELCYIYWSHTGTDCGRCVSVCPYSHSRRLLHNLVRWAVRRSSLFRRMAIPLDTLFYGRKPPPAQVPKWMRFAGETRAGDPS